MKNILFSLLQKALNRYLALDPESAKRIQGLEGKTVLLTLLGAGISLQLVFRDGRIQIKHDDFLTSDTTIQGMPLSLLHMKLTRGDRKQFFAEDVAIEGDLDVAQSVMDLFDQLEIDWEEYLSHWVGDVPSHQVGRFVRHIKKTARRAQEVLLQNVNEYVHEEADLFPPTEAMQDFFNDVDELRLDVDRLSARIALIRGAK